MAIAEAPIRPVPVPAEDEKSPVRLDFPESAKPVELDWGYLVNISVIHLLSVPIVLPWFFSWTGLFLFVIGLPLYGLFGITLCYHRLLTHQGLTLPKWLERSFAILGVCCLQDTPARWVAVHRLHHRHSDCQSDPHSPLVSFFWSHVGWVLVKNRDHSRISFFEQYARDILRDPLYFALERNLAWFWVYWLHAVFYFVAGAIAGRAMEGTWWGGLQFGASVLVWGVFFRTVFVWHATWAVNSVTHVIGYRNYETSDDSRNFWMVALIAYGEGWHNNHHADQRAAAHGHRWWELDMTYHVIQALEALGLAKNVVRPRAWRKQDAALKAAAFTESAPAVDLQKADRQP